MKPYPVVLWVSCKRARLSFEFRVHLVVHFQNVQALLLGPYACDVPQVDASNVCARARAHARACVCVVCCVCVCVCVYTPCWSLQLCPSPALYFQLSHSALQKGA